MEKQTECIQGGPVQGRTTQECANRLMENRNAKARSRRDILDISTTRVGNTRPMTLPGWQKSSRFQKSPRARCGVSVDGDEGSEDQAAPMPTAEPGNRPPNHLSAKPMTREGEGKLTRCCSLLADLVSKMMSWRRMAPPFETYPYFLPHQVCHRHPRLGESDRRSQRRCVCHRVKKQPS